MKNMRNGAIAAVLLAATTSGCTGDAARASETTELPAPLPVVVARAEIAAIHASYKTTANIAADAEAPVLARVGGEVVEILVEEGENVRKGQVLARLDGDRLRLEMLRAKAEYEQALREYTRMTDLHDRSLISTAAFEDQKYSTDALRAAYELKRLDYEYTAIRATISGVVSSRAVKLGTNVELGQPTFKVTDTSRLVAYLSIPQTELGKFEAGLDAIVLVDSAPDSRFVGTVERLSPTIDMATGTFRATVYIDNADRALAPGMFGRFAIAYDERRDAIVIPAGAVVREDNQAIVYVVEDGAAVRRTIRTGIQSDGRVEVTEGLGGDESVVLSGQSRLRNGSRVLASVSPDRPPVSG